MKPTTARHVDWRAAGAGLAVAVLLVGLIYVVGVLSAYQSSGEGCRRDISRSLVADGYDVDTAEWLAGQDVQCRRSWRWNPVDWERDR